MTAIKIPSMDLEKSSNDRRRRRPIDVLPRVIFSLSFFSFLPLLLLLLFFFQANWFNNEEAEVDDLSTRKTSLELVTGSLRTT